MNDLKSHLEGIGVDSGLLQITLDILKAINSVRILLAESDAESSSDKNPFGDVQLNVDKLADNIFYDMCRNNKSVYCAGSEEDPFPRVFLKTENETKAAEINKFKCDNNSPLYGVFFDPLDGSSVAKCKWSVGSIIAVWDVSDRINYEINSNSFLLKTNKIIEEKEKEKDNYFTLKNCDNPILNKKVSEMCLSVIAIYGPSTSVVLKINNYLFEYGINNKGIYLKSDKSFNKNKEEYLIPKKGCKTFSPANLRATCDLPSYDKLVRYYIENRYTLRYTGALVPDVYQQLKKDGGGIFISPVSERSPTKLRLIFEVAPIAMIIEAAGGVAVNEKGCPIRELIIEDPFQKSGLCCGVEEEVLRYISFLSDENSS